MSSSPASIVWEPPRELMPVAARCVSLPFTAPTLSGMRVRAVAAGSANSGALEMLLGNPAGGRGVYVARWSALRAFAPSVHDIVLAERIGEAIAAGAALSPAVIHAAAIAVAAAGHAGQRIAVVAQRAQEAERLGLRRLRAHLLLELARQLDLPGSHSALNDPWSTQPQEQGGWLAEAPARLAMRLDDMSWRSQELAQAIACIAQLAWPIGLGPYQQAARLPRVLRLLLASGQQIRNLNGNANLEEARLTRLVQARAALDRARALLLDPLSLLASWREDRPGLLHTLEAPDWLLDGWARLCLMPSDAAETGALLQGLLHDSDSDRAPRKAELDTFAPAALCPIASFERLARNEAIRLRELQLHDPDLAECDG